VEWWSGEVVKWTSSKVDLTHYLARPCYQRLGSFLVDCKWVVVIRQSASTRNLR
jgi:hypothetical protein